MGVSYREEWIRIDRLYKETMAAISEYDACPWWHWIRKERLRCKRDAAVARWNEKGYYFA